MSSMGRAPVRHPAPELPEDALRSTTELEGTPQGGEHMLAYMRLLWEHRRMLARVALYGLLSSAVLAFLIPNRYQSTARIMPPDSNQSGGLAMAAAALSGGAGGFGSIANEMLGLKSNSDIFVGILSSRTVKDKLIQEFDLKKLYGARRMEDARTQLAEHTGLDIDRKSQIITISVTDDAKKWIIEKTAADRTYGARPLRRALQKFVEDPLSEALIGGGIVERPAFLEVYMENNQLFYRPVSADGEEKMAGMALSAV